MRYGTCMNRLMIIPAAGLGKRLQSTTPKVLFPVNGKPMIDHLLGLYAEVVECFIIVLHPSFESEVKDYCDSSPFHIEYEIQESPTGMLDAILIPGERVKAQRPDNIWITWCDQIAVRPQTVTKLAKLSGQYSDTALIFPTIFRTKPYIHLVRNDTNEIIDVLHQREGDELPPVGESDMGLFCLSCYTYLNLLPNFARNFGRAAVTQERNFLPFIPWIQRRAEVKTFHGLDAIETVGINTLTDLNRVEKYLRNERKSAFGHYPCL